MSYSGPARRLPSEHLDAHAQHLELILARTPILDVRAPAEFERGHMPNSRNLPILNDDERHRVGLVYARHGNEAATRLGHELVAGKTREERIQGWCRYLQAHPDAWLTCWRGGQRSEIAQGWLAAAGRHVERVPGGFKALRRLCVLLLEAAADDPRQWWIVGGRTGSAKTVLVNELPASIDLEGLANHRGSAFGSQTTAQPAPVTFENALAAAFARGAAEHLVLEDESRTIGRLALPQAWYQRMQQAPLVIVEAPLATRVGHIKREYVDAPLAAGTEPAELHERYGAALDRIARRLGGDRHRALTGMLAAAFDGSAGHEPWIERLLCQYYDPMYDYQLEQKARRIRFRGTYAEVLHYLRRATAA